MKKAQRTARDFKKLRDQLKGLSDIVKSTKDGNLWNHESGIRKKLRFLKNNDFHEFADYDSVVEGYLALLDYVSERIINYYNHKNGTDYKFADIVAKNRKSYLSSGVMSVLVTSHIPKLVSKEFSRVFPQNPKDEYPRARAMKRKFFLHLGDTNTGKTYSAVEKLKKADRGIYLAPLRILALENYEKLNRDGVPCNLITGEEELLTDSASHVCSTVEKLPYGESFDVAVIDEIQMISDPRRGSAWTRAVLGLRCAEVHLCGALSAKELVCAILDDCEEEYEVIEYKRDTPLKVLNKPFTLSKLEKGDALVAFSKRRVLELSKFCLERGMPNSVIYGDLPPEVRRMQFHAFLSGKNKILVTTDAVGMGVNLPIRRIILTSLHKFDGDETRLLLPQEVKQIGGRAGRKGIYDVGYVGSMTEEAEYISEYLEVPDAPLESAALGPGEAIVGIKGLPLREKLALWSMRSEKLPIYKKMDVRDFLLILDSIKSFSLPEETEYRLMLLPFDAGNLEIAAYFLSVVEDFFKKKNGRPKPPETGVFNLSSLETYYQKLNLYYSFCKTFNVEFEPSEVYRERDRIAKKINSLLTKL
ncbi:MAG: helicase-related protein [Eubacteriales bacterium]|nr:helicase-related protein [Eubacteriales bacterium]MDD4475964.1 helicase-related protein [Eubacteriales bacterium]